MAELATLDTQPPYNPPTSRIGTASNASDFVFRLIDGDQLRAIHRTKIKGQVDGNAPYKRAELEAKGMGANTNLNFRQASAIINQFKTPYYDLAVEVPLLADVQTSFGLATEKTQWSQIISEEFDRMLKSWDDWDFIEQYHQYIMLVFGVSVAYFHDKVDWRPDIAKPGEVLVPDGTRCRLDELEIVTILKSYPSHQLYRYIRNKPVAEELGWNVLATEQAIIDAYSGTGTPPADINNYEWYQQKIKNADLYYGTYESRQVQVAHELVKEFDGKVSHHMVRADRTSDTFLYSHIDRFDSMEDVICPFFYDIGDGTWHSIRGLGYEIYPYCEVFNRLRCKEVDGAGIASSILFQQNSADNVTKSQLLTINNLGIIPHGLTLLPTQIGQGIEATMGVRRDMEQGLYNNIGSMSKAPGTASPRKSEGLGMLEMQQSASLGKGSINRYYTNRDRYLQAIYKRASNPNYKTHQPGGKEAVDFQRRCIARGVPIEAIVSYDSVKAMRSIGAGSAVNALMVTEQIYNIAASFPEEGRQLAIRDYVARLAGQTAAERYMGDANTSQSTEDNSIAGLENASLRSGQAQNVVITMQQSHVIHLQSHLSDMEAHVQEYGQQQAQGQTSIPLTQSLFVHLDGGGRHSLEHLKAIQNDPIRKGDFEAFYKRWQALAHVQDQVKQQLDEQMQAAQEQQAQSQTQPDDLIERIDYNHAPESVKMLLEQAAGVPRQQGDLSVPALNLQNKGFNTQLKAEKQNQQGKLADVKLAHELITSKNTPPNE